MNATYTVNRTDPPHAVLADSIVEGLMAVADEVLIPMEETYPQHIAALQGEVADARNALETLEAEIESLMDQILEKNPDGSHVLGEVVRRGVAERYEELKSNRLRLAEERVQAKCRELDEAKAQWAKERTAVSDTLLLHLVAALREPRATNLNSLIKTAVRIDDIYSEPIRRHRHSGTRVSWRGTVRLEGAGQRFEIGFSGTYEFGAVTTVVDKVEKIIEFMAQGVPFPEMHERSSPYYMSRIKDLHKAVGERLGWPARCPLMSCRNGLLTQIGVHLALHGRDVAATSAALNKPEELVGAVNTMLDSGRPTWGKLAVRFGV